MELMPIEDLERLPVKVIAFLFVLILNKQTFFGSQSFLHSMHLKKLSRACTCKPGNINVWGSHYTTDWFQYDKL